MQSKKKLITVVTFLLLLIAAAIFHRPLLHSAIHAGSSATLPAVGGALNDFTVTDLAGKAWTLKDLQKRTESGVVCLTFWCTFCHSCRRMDNRFQALAAEFKDKAAVVGIDASAADTSKKVEDFARDKKFSVPVFLDQGGKVADQFGVKMTTTTLVIDKAGVVRYRGQFGGEVTPYARDALSAVLQGKEPTVKETAPAG